MLRLNVSVAAVLSLLLIACGGAGDGTDRFDAGALPPPAGGNPTSPGSPDGGTQGNNPDAGTGGTPDAGTVSFYQPKGSGKFSGTVSVPAGHSVKNVLMIACAEQGDDCDPTRSAAVLIKTEGGSAPFVLEGLDPQGSFLVIAWKDLNGSNTADANDLIGMFNVNAQKTYVTPDRNDLTVLTVVYGAMPQGRIQGRLTVPAGQSVENVIIEACPLTTNGCDKTRALAWIIQTSGQTIEYAVEGLGTDRYMVHAFKDLVNVNPSAPTLDPGDLYGFFTWDGEAMTPVVAPSAGIDLTLKAIPQPPTGSVPSELHGEWGYVITSGVDYYNDQYASWQPPSGMSKSLTLNANGTFTLSSLTQSVLYSCVITLSTYYEGLAFAQNGELRLEPQSTWRKYESNCNPSRNSEGYYPNAPMHLRYALSGSTLKVTAPDNSVWDFHKK